MTFESNQKSVALSEIMMAVDLPIKMARKDIKQASVAMGNDEARFLVKYYYTMQNDRLRFGNQTRTLTKGNQETTLLNFLGDRSGDLEGIVKKALHDYVSNHPVGRWMLNIYGIGPVTSACLLSEIDISICPTAGHIQSYAGLNPNMVWEKGTRRPFSANMKKTCWHIGQSFMKFSGKDDCFYGKLYLERKAYEKVKNEAGEYADQAARLLSDKKYTDGTVTKEKLLEGKLSDAHIDARARRWAVKMFLSHLHMVWYKHHFGVDAPKPYAIDILKHAHMINPVVGEAI